MKQHVYSALSAAAAAHALDACSTLFLRIREKGKFEKYREKLINLRFLNSHLIIPAGLYKTKSKSKEGHICQSIALDSHRFPLDLMLDLDL